MTNGWKRGSFYFYHFRLWAMYIMFCSLSASSRETAVCVAEELLYNDRSVFCWCHFFLTNLMFLIIVLPSRCVPNCAWDVVTINVRSLFMPFFFQHVIPMIPVCAYCCCHLLNSAVHWRYLKIDYSPLIMYSFQTTNCKV